MLESRWLANCLMGLYPELSPGGGAMPGINPWGNMRGNTVYHFASVTKHLCRVYFSYRVRVVFIIRISAI